MLPDSMLNCSPFNQPTTMPTTRLWSPTGPASLMPVTTSEPPKIRLMLWPTGLKPSSSTLNGAAAADHPEDEYNDRHHQQNVNQPSTDISNQAQKPKN